MATLGTQYTDRRQPKNKYTGAIGVMIVWLLDLQLPVQSVPFTTKVVSSNPIHGEVYKIQHSVIKFVSDLRQVSAFLRFPPPMKLTTIILAEALLKVVLNSISCQTPTM
jgi:hypothetical protein